MPPVGVKLTTDVERRTDGFRARVRWTDPSTHKRVGRVAHVRSHEDVEEFFEQGALEAFADEPQFEAGDLGHGF